MIDTQTDDDGLYVTHCIGKQNKSWHLKEYYKSPYSSNNLTKMIFSFTYILYSSSTEALVNSPNCHIYFNVPILYWSINCLSPGNLPAGHGEGVLLLGRKLLDRSLSLLLFPEDGLSSDLSLAEDSLSDQDRSRERSLDNDRSRSRE